MLHREYVLPPQGELRISIPFEPKNTAAVMLQVFPSSTTTTSSSFAALKVENSTTTTTTDGTSSSGSTTSVAEILGSELQPSAQYIFGPGRSFSVYAGAGGCIVKIEADPKVMRDVYSIPHAATSMKSVLDLHNLLNYKRSEAYKAGPDALGPRVLILGAEPSTGKSTIAKILGNYAVRSGYHPIMVDLDALKPNMAITPGVFTLSCLQHPMDIEEGFGFVPHVSYFVGYAGGSVSSSHSGFMEGHSTLLMHHITALAECCDQRSSRSDRCRLGGLIVDCPTLDNIKDLSTGAFSASPSSTSSSTTANDYADESLDFILHAIQELGIDTVVIVGSEKLRHQLRRYMAIKEFIKEKNKLLVPSSLSPTDAATEHTLEGEQEEEEDLTAEKNRKAAQQTDQTEKFLHFAMGAPNTVTLQSGLPLRMIVMPALDGVQGNPIFAERELAIREKWRSYFFGSLTAPLSPQTVEFPLSQIRFAQVTTMAAETLAGLLPIDRGNEEAHSSGSSVQVSLLGSLDLPNLSHRVVGLSDVSFAEKRMVVPSSTAGTSLLQELPISVVENKLKGCVVLGFAWVLSVTNEGAVKMLLPMKVLPTSCVGPIFLVSETTL